jgi:hypothetical protein
MGSWNDVQRCRIIVRGCPKLLAAIILRSIHPHPFFHPRNIKFQGRSTPWTAIVGDGQKIMEDWIVETPQQDEVIFKKYCKLHDLNCLQLFGECEKSEYSWSNPLRIDDEYISFAFAFNLDAENQKYGDEIQEEIFKSNVLFALWMRCCKNQNKGWMHDGSITIDKYELGGDELIMTLSTICCCTNNELSLPAWISGSRASKSFSLWSDQLEVMTISDVHRLSDANENYLMAGNKFNKLLKYHSIDSWPDFNFIDLVFQSGLWMRLCCDPFSFSPLEHIIYDFIAEEIISSRDKTITGWTALRVDRNHFMHSVRIIQRSIKYWLYNPDDGVIYKKLKLSYEGTFRGLNSKT